MRSGRCPAGVSVSEGGRDDGRGENRRAGLHRVPQCALAEDLVEQPDIERLNKEIKRRADVVEISPNPAAFLRLATAVASKPMTNGR